MGKKAVKNGDYTLEVPESVIREYFKLLSSRTITSRTVSVARCIANVAQAQVLEIVKSSMTLAPSGRCYLIPAEVMQLLSTRLTAYKEGKCLPLPKVALG